MNNFPTGTVTFLFTDIEGSTKLAQQYPDAMPVLLARHNEILTQSIQAHNGYVFRIVGDAFSAAFHKAGDALNAALEAQTKLKSESWSPASIKARMGIHTGVAEWMGRDHEPEYEGYETLAMASRVMSAGNGGQILLSHHAHELAKDKAPDNATFKDLGEYNLKDFLEPQTIYQLTVPDLTPDFPPLKTLRSVRNNLPLHLTSFIGRERELAESQDKFTLARLLTLIGPGGTGKTRLSLQVALEQIGNFKDGVWLVELAPISEAAFIVSTIAAVFNLREVQGMPLVNIVTDYLRAKELLLVLDNCEHLVVASAQIVDQLLHACPYLKIIASSREALGIDGETVYRVPSLKEDEATRLFVERATKAEPRFHLTKENGSFVAQICSRLDGIPLAIELAAARVNIFTPQQIAERLDDRFKLLTGGSRTALPRQQTLRALIDWSYQTLNETEQRALRRLAVFSGGWMFEAGEAVVGESEALDGLTGLVNKSLVNVEEQDGNSRYAFLETIRQYALDKLVEANEASATRNRHMSYFLAFAETAAEKLYAERNKHWLNAFASEYDDLRSALRWALDHEPLSALKLCGWLGDFWLVRGYLVEGRKWAHSALDSIENLQSDNGEIDRIRARGFHVLAALSNNQGEHRIARDAAEKSITLYRQIGDSLRLARVLVIHATACGFAGDLNQAFASLKESENISRAMNHKGELAWALGALAYLTSQVRGDAAQNEINAYAEESMALSQETGDPFAVLRSKEILARQAYARGDVVEVRKYGEQLLIYYREAGMSLMYVSTKSEIAHAMRRIGNFEEALAHYRESIMMYKEMGHRGAIAHQLECFAFIAITQEHSERAVRLLGAAEALRETSNSRMTPQERIEYDKQVADLRTGMDEKVFTSLWAKGRSMTFEQAIKYAVDVTNE